MKFIKVFGCLFFLVGLGLQNSEGQKWIWAKAAVNSNGGSCDPTAISIDSNGNILEAGIYNSIEVFPPYTLNDPYPGYNSAYIVKYNPSGKVLWVGDNINPTPYSSCDGYLVATDRVGNSYFGGSFDSSVTFGGHLITNSNGGNCAFLTKYSPSGVVLWVQKPVETKIFSNTEGLTAITDKWNSIYMAGYFSGTVSFGSYSLNDSGGLGYSGIFIVKYDSTGDVKWAIQSYGGNYTYANSPSICIDTAGNTYLAGPCFGRVRFGTQSYSSQGGRNNLFLAKFDTAGNAKWITGPTLLSPTGFLEDGVISGGIAATGDNAGNIYVAGVFYDSVGFGNYHLHGAYGGDTNIVIAKYNSNGQVIWAKMADCYGPTPPFGLNSEDVFSLSADRWGSIYVCGTFNRYITLGTITLSEDSIEPSYIFKLDSAGNAICGTVINNDNDDFNGVVADPLAPNVYFDGDCAAQTNGGGGNSSCLFGNIELSGLSDEWSFLAKMTCSKCQFIPTISSTTTVCLGKSDRLVANGGSNYLWSNGDTISIINVTPSTSTEFYVTVTKDSCSMTDSIDIKVYPYPVPIISSNQVICSSQSANLSVSEGFIYLWSTGDTTSSIQVTPTTNTTYSVVVSNGYCSIPDSVNVIVNPIPNANICCDSIITHGEKVQLITSGGQSYSWSPSAGLSCDTCPNPIAAPAQTTIYTVTVSSDSGCTATRTLTIDVSCGAIFIPTAFAPNQLGYNNILYVRGPCIAQMDFNVFDRWGNRVFESESLDYGWDGTYKGQVMNTGNYMWYLKATLTDGTTVDRKGNVALVR